MKRCEKKGMALKAVKEAIRTPVGTTILVTIAVIILLVVLTMIKDTILEGKTIDYSILFLALVPFLIYLAVSGKISEIGGGGFWVKFNKVSAAKVFSKESQEYSRFSVSIFNKAVAEMRIEKLKNEFRLKRHLPSTLMILKSIECKEAEAPLIGETLKAYLEELTKYEIFKYVGFIDENDVFCGYMYARCLLDWLSDKTEKDKIIADIKDWNIDKIPGVKKDYVYNYQSNRETLRIMDEEGIKEIAVLDKKKRFIDFTTPEMIVSRIINNLMNDAK